MPVPPGHSSSIDSTSSLSSSKSSLLAQPVDASSQSDIADPNLLYMSRADAYAFGVASSPSQATSKAGAAVSATQKFKRAFGKRRRPPQDAGTLLSSGDERSTSDFGPSSSSSNLPPSLGVAHLSGARPSAAKLTMHLFSGRKPGQAPDPNEPPPLPPKPPALRAPIPPTPHMPATISNKLSTNTPGSHSRSSIMATSPSINPAIEFMLEDEEYRRVAAEQRRGTTPVQNGELEQHKEDWRKSDSTMATVRPTHPPDSGPGAASKRLSTFVSTQPSTGDLDFSFDFLGVPLEETRSLDVSEVNGERQFKRRSLSLNVQVPSKYTPASMSPSSPTHAYAASPYSSPLPTSDSASMGSTHSPAYSIALPSPPRDAPTTTRTRANGIIGTGTASGAPVYKANIRGRLAALTTVTGTAQRSTSPLAASTSSPSLTSPSSTSLHRVVHRRVPVTSMGDQPSPDLQAVAAVRKLPNRMRSPSATSSSGAAGIRQAATSLTSGAGAMARGLGKRAYDKVGRVWHGSGSGSGSGSDTPSNHYRQRAGVNGISGTHTLQPPPLSPNFNYGPSAFPSRRRTPNAPSGTWSVASISASRSSSEKDSTVGGRDTPPSGSGAPGSGGLGRLIRPPRGTGGGAVFGRELWECVKDTKVSEFGAGGDALANRMIPALVLRCSRHLHKWGLEEEGLFRISGRSSHINRLRHEFDSGADYDIVDCSPSELDPHAVASVFKAYLRELPEPILSHSLGHLFDAAMSAESSRAAPVSPSGILQKTISASPHTMQSGPRAIPVLRRPPSLSTFTLPTSSSLRAPSASLVETLGDLISRLPRENQDLLQTVVELMQATAQRSKDTKMPLSNLLLVFCPSLSMGPTLLRVLCDAPGIWDRAPAPVSGPPDEEPAETDDSESDSDLESEVGRVVALPPKYKGKEREASIEPFTIPTTPPVPPGEAEGGLSDWRPEAVRRVPVPTFHLEDQHLQCSGPFGDESFTPPLRTDSLPRSESMPSVEVPSRSLTPSLSSPQPSVSPASVPMPDNDSLVSSLRNLQFFSLPLATSDVAPSRAVPNHDKALPASPRPFLKMATEGRASSTSQLISLKEAYPAQTSSLPTSPVLASHSAPSVVFPSAKTAPTTPTSPIKHTLPQSIGRNSKSLYDDNMPSSSKPLTRRPSLNLLLNLTRSGSPSPRSRTPAISGPISSPFPVGQPMSSVKSSPNTMTSAFPPVLNFPIEGNVDDGLGWDDVFGASGESAAALPQPRSTAISQPSAQSPWLQRPPSSPRRPTTEYLTSSNGPFTLNGPPAVIHSAPAALEAAKSATKTSSSLPEGALPLRAGVSSSPVGIPSSPGGVPPSPGGATLVPFPEDSSSGDDSPTGNSAAKITFSATPHLSFQLRRSSLEDEDWASAVLMAAGKLDRLVETRRSSHNSPSQQQA